MAQTIPNTMEAFWMPFTANRQFKKAPRLFARAEGMMYYTPDGREVIDGTSGLWAVNAGHCRPSITEAIQKTAAELDYASCFQMGHPLAFQFAERLGDFMPGDLKRIFFTNSGSESCDTALKIALGYHYARGEGRRITLIGRERGYHGTNFGGISVGGIVTNRKSFGQRLPFIDHLPHTLSIEHAAFSKGQPDWGVHLADELERLVALHGGDSIAAVIVEPLAGSTGVLVPPKGYLERLRDICTKYGILLIFDEVITAFGRLGAATAAERFGVTPDIITMAKGLTNAAVPAGAVAVSEGIYQAFMQGPEHLIELFHGYTYSGHPLAAAAGLATLQIYEEEKLFENAAALEPYWQEALHSLRGHPHIIDIRNLGLVGGIELEPRPGEPTKRAMGILQDCFDNGLSVRSTGDIIALSPPLILNKAHIDRMMEILSSALKRAV